MRTSSIVSLALASSLAWLGGCAVKDERRPSVVPTAEPATLLVLDDVDGYFQALVSGEVAVNPQGCVTVGDEVLYAPEGSRWAEDGRTLELTGYPPVALGEEVTLGGGHQDLTGEQIDDELRVCLSEDVRATVVAVVAPGDPEG